MINPRLYSSRAVRSIRSHPCFFFALCFAYVRARAYLALRLLLSAYSASKERSSRKYSSLLAWNISKLKRFRSTEIVPSPYCNTKRHAGRLAFSRLILLLEDRGVFLSIYTLVIKKSSRWIKALSIKSFFSSYEHLMMMGQKIIK